MTKLDASRIGGHKVFRWTKEYLFNVLTSGTNPAVTNPDIIAAFAYFDRADFLPLNYKSRAYEDNDIDIGFGEKVTRPSTILKMIEMLGPKKDGRYLDIGTGTGMSAMILGFIAGDQGKVFSIERIQWLWETARSCSSKYKDIKNVHFLYRDGIEGLPEQAPFDGIHVSFYLKEIPETLKQQLSKDGGKLVIPTNNYDIRIIERIGDDFTEEIVPGFIFNEGKAGIG